MSGDVNDETAASIGKFLGASYVITGQLVNARSSLWYGLFCLHVYPSRDVLHAVTLL
jgi:hypothetical protein